MEIRKAMLSQPMAGKTDEEIEATRNRAIADLKSRGFEIVNTLFTDEWYNSDKMKERGVVQIPLCFLAKSLENMSLCHAAYFCNGWQEARGCRIEHEVAKAYGLEIIYEGVGSCLQKESQLGVVRWNGENIPLIDAFIDGAVTIKNGFNKEKTLILTDHRRNYEVTYYVHLGDYIVKDKNGRFTVYDEEEFNEKFTEVSDNG